MTMEKSINRVELRGNVGFDPRINSLEDGVQVMRLSLATNEAYKNKKGEWQEETVWHNIVAWAGKGMPEFSSIRKGNTLSVTGRIKPVQYQTKTGVERQTYEIVALSIKHHLPESFE
ncbi:MAG: single-stranded DNA-binding protein [Bacteroidetes bacterium HGW-Bacteroidetes-10]|jgi:single-strand DNA-binding protein|nr:MAG: single-stranded DNA-binding protein [Bacteroidetes bacterium HGW-Bacteroidetes-10]